MPSSSKRWHNVDRQGRWFSKDTKWSPLCFYGTRGSGQRLDFLVLRRSARRTLDGSAGGGLILFKDGKFTFFDTEVGLFSNEIDCVVGDDRGDIWLSSGKGIGYVKRRGARRFCRWQDSKDTFDSLFICRWC